MRRQEVYVFERMLKMRVFYDRDADVSLLKSKKVAVVACMRKYLTMLNAMARDQAPWAPRVA